MLCRLHIERFALIDHLELAVKPGFTVLTGETGAGKSILLGALGLLLGERPQGNPLQDAEKQAVMIAECDLTDHLQAIVEESGVVIEDDTLMIKRVLLPNGKNRCFINDQPVGVALLKLLGEYLVEIHGQHGQAGLHEATTHRLMVDSFAGLSKEVYALADVYNAWKEAEKKLLTLKEQIQQALKQPEQITQLIIYQMDLN